jgi:hypothetical protein
MLTSMTTRKWPNNRYRRITVDGKSVYEHRVVWERTHGPIPRGFHIHHKDENPLNNALNNLECLPHGVHTAHHTTKSFRACEAEGCGRKHYARGYCTKHYQQQVQRDLQRELKRQYRATHPEYVDRERAASREAARRRREAA